MLQIMQQNFLLYGIAALGLLGAISQVILRGIYGRLVRDMERPALAKGKYMKQLRQKYNTCRRLHSGADSIYYFIQKSMMEYKCLGMNLHTWRRMGVAILIVSLALCAGGWYLAGSLGMAQSVQQSYLWASAASVLLIAGAYGVTDTEYRRKYLETGLKSLFSGASMPEMQEIDLSEREPADIQVKEMREPQEAKEDKSAKDAKAKRLFSDARGKRGKIIETKAQKEKRELKENLSKLKEGMAESAAAVAEKTTEQTKQRNAEILRQMDSAEQERIIREMLKEFLA